MEIENTALYPVDLSQKIEKVLMYIFAITFVII